MNKRRPDRSTVRNGRIDHIIRDSTQFGQACLRMWSKVMYNGGLATRWCHLHGVAGNPGANTFHERRGSRCVTATMLDGDRSRRRRLAECEVPARRGARLQHHRDVQRHERVPGLYDLVVSYEQCTATGSSPVDVDDRGCRRRAPLCQGRPAIISSSCRLRVSAATSGTLRSV